MTKISLLRRLTVQTRMGFTLVEVMITVSIIGALVLVVAPLFIHTTRYWLLHKAKVELQRDARNALHTMTRQIRQAQSSTVVIDRGSGQPYYSRIQFTDINGRAISYYQNNNFLMMTLAGRTSELSDKLRFVNFYFPRSDDMTIVSVSLTFEKSIYEGKTKALHMASERVRVMD